MITLKSITLGTAAVLAVSLHLSAATTIEISGDVTLSKPIKPSGTSTTGIKVAAPTGDTTNRKLTMASGNTYAGGLELDGTTVVMLDASGVGTAATAKFTARGGAINSAADLTLASLAKNGPATLSGAGNFTVTTLTGAGDLTVGGSGNTTIKGSLPAGAGNYNINAGTCILTSNATVTTQASGNFTIANGAILDLAANKITSAGLTSGLLVASAGSTIKIGAGAFDKDITLG